ncbi:MAG: hypothetical protein AAGI92_06205 [Pseudomonadota bacterium]
MVFATVLAALVGSAHSHAVGVKEVDLSDATPADGRTFETRSGDLYRLSGIDVPVPGEMC